MQTRSVEHQPQLVGVLVGGDAAAPLIPVQDDLAVAAFLDDIPVDVDVARCRPQTNRSGLDRLPSGARQAVLRRMHRVALPLAGVVADVQRERARRGSRRTAVDVLVDAERRHDVVLEWPGIASGPVADPQRQARERGVRMRYVADRPRPHRSGRRSTCATTTAARTSIMGPHAGGRAHPTCRQTG